LLRTYTFQPTGFLNDLVVTREAVYVTDSVTGQLFRVDPDTGVGEAIDLGGASASFGDGLELVGRTLYVVRNQLEEIAVFRLGARLETARLVGSIVPAEDAADVPTTVAFQAGRLWAVNARFGTDPESDTDYWITRLPTRP
jgi:hypothetical protein